MKLQFLASVFTGVALAIQAPTTSAAILTYEFAGALNDPFGTLPAGTPFTGSFSYDDSQPLNTPLTPYRGDYHYTSLSVTMGGVTVTDNGTGPMYVFDAPYPTDLWYLYTYAVAGTFGGLTLAPQGLMICLQDGTRAVFNSPALPGPCLALSDFPSGGGTFLQLESETQPGHLLNVRGNLTAFSMSSVVNDQTPPTIVGAVGNCHDGT
ncbi:MAG: hypothetical protein NTW03_00280, partial [Verrucomicrobia bacterium]|nr:hypothetical protein [Verrucomicrobiota bacterium]